MTTVQSLYLFLWVLVLLECFVRLPKGRLWLSRSFFGWQPPGRGLAFTFGARQWVFLNPVPLFAGIALPPSPEQGHSAPLRYDVTSLAQRIAPAEDLRFTCSISATLLFVVLIVLAPLAVVARSFDYVIIPVLGAVYISNFMAVAIWHGCHARLFPEKNQARLLKALHLLIYPPATLRCAVELPAALLEEHCPPAIAAALIGPRRAKKWLRETYLKRLLGPERAGDGQNEEMAIFAGMLEELYGEIPRPAAEPEHHDPEALAFCPACNTRYIRTDGTCSFCPGIALHPLCASETGPNPRQNAEVV